MKYDVTFHPSWWNKRLGIDFTETFFDDAAFRISADENMRRFLWECFGEWGIGEENPSPRPVLGSDLIASGYLFSEMLGCEIRYGAANPPEVVCADYDDDSIGSMEVPNLESSVPWQRMESQIRTMVETYGEVRNAVNLQGVLNLALDTRGDAVMMDMYLNPDLARHLFSVCHRTLVNAGVRLAELSQTMSGGVTAITNQLAYPGLFVHSNCSVEMVSLDTYSDFLLEYDIALSEAFQPYGVHHCGASMEHVVEGYARIPNLAFGEIGAGSDIGKVREALPDTWLNLRYSPVKLASVPQAELEMEIAEMYRNAGGSGSQTSISCVGIDSDVDDSQIRVFLETCRQQETEIS